MKQVFVDGSAGTTGLQIMERLRRRSDIRLLTLPEERRKDEASRREIMNDADLVILCLPDAAAREAAAMIRDPDTRVIDASTAHRVHPDWAYGFPELTGQRDQIRAARRVANPGCHASGLIALVRPLVEQGLLSPDTQISCFSLTGYTGGGKQMIAGYESADRPSLLDAPRMYGLSQQHKHLPEMTQVSGLRVSPIFCPVVAPFDRGMEVVVPLFADGRLTRTAVTDCLRGYYTGGTVRFVDGDSEDGFLSANALRGTDIMQLTVAGNEERLLLVARFDNLGKGACGAAIQNMNLMLGVDEYTGLVLSKEVSSC